MTTVYDVPAKELIDTVAEELKKDKNIKKPEESGFWRTGVSKENPPMNPDWWLKRCASVLRKIYIKEGVGVSRLKSEYGGKKNLGSKTHKTKSGSGAIIRKAMQQLEDAGYVKKVKGKGRIVTSKGRSFLDNMSKEVLKKVKSYHPDLEKY